MSGDRGLANDQGFGDLSIGKATPDQHDHFHLSLGETMPASTMSIHSRLLRERHGFSYGLGQW
jgi:hypothetical protein